MNTQTKLGIGFLTAFLFAVGLIVLFTPETAAIDDKALYLQEMQSLHDQAESKRTEIRLLQLEIEELQAKWRTLDFKVSNKQLTSDPLLQGVYFTSYNPVVWQTDSTPCIAGGTGFNLCEMATNGQRPIALSQELVSWSIYGDNTDLSAGDHIWLESIDYPDDPRCNGEFIVSDSMNARYTNRGDLFFMNSKDNTSCSANVYLME